MVKRMFRVKDSRTGRIVAYVKSFDDGKRLATINHLEEYEVMPCLLREEKEEKPDDGNDPSAPSGE